MEKRYKKRSHISDAKIREILKYFSLDLTATNTAKLVRISRSTINKYYDRFRKIILFSLKANENIADKGIFELNESYFGVKRVRGKRGRGAAGKTPVVGLLKRGGKVHVQVVQDCSRQQLMPV